MRRKTQRRLLIGVLAVLLFAGAPVLQRALFRPSLVYLAPDPTAGDEVVFLALGDQGTGKANQRQVAQHMEQVCSARRDVHFALLLGDNFYFDGVESVQSPRWLDTFEWIYDGPCLQGLPFYAVLGNHDYKGNVQAQIHYGVQRLGSGRWRMPYRYYRKGFGHAAGRTLLELVVLDTNRGPAQQLDRLLSQVPRDHTWWRIVAGHHAIRSKDTRYGDNADYVASLLPLLREHRVDVYLAGHSHNLQLLAPAGEPTYIVSGAGGKRLYDLQQPAGDDGFLYGAKAFGFVTMEVRQAALLLTFHRVAPQEAVMFRLGRPCPTDHQSSLSCTRAVPVRLQNRTSYPEQ